MVRLYKLLNEHKYLESAIQLAGNFRISTDKGGVLRKVEISKNKTFLLLEEYPTDNLTGVLNGHIFGMWGLYDLGTIEKDIAEYFNILSTSLIENFSIWDGKFWSLYDSRHLDKKLKIMLVHYHMLHIKMFIILYELQVIRNMLHFVKK